MLSYYIVKVRQIVVSPLQAGHTMRNQLLPPGWGQLLAGRGSPLSFQPLQSPTATAPYAVSLAQLPVVQQVCQIPAHAANRGRGQQPLPLPESLRSLCSLLNRCDMDFAEKGQLARYNTP